jgi:hypothetical protein
MSTSDSLAAVAVSVSVSVTVTVTVSVSVSVVRFPCSVFPPTSCQNSAVRLPGSDVRALRARGWWLWLGPFSRRPPHPTASRAFGPLRGWPDGHP